jgi:hypothetical protein
VEAENGDKGGKIRAGVENPRGEGQGRMKITVQRLEDSKMHDQAFHGEKEGQERISPRQHSPYTPSVYTHISMRSIHHDTIEFDPFLLGQANSQLQVLCVGRVIQVDSDRYRGSMSANHVSLCSITCTAIVPGLTH